VRTLFRNAQCWSAGKEIFDGILVENGIIIADNVLFHGDVLQETVTGKSAKAIQAFNEFVANDNTTQQVMLTVRDGLTLIRKK